MSGAAVFTSYVEKLKGKKVEMKGDRVDILRDNPLAYDLSSELLTDELPWQKTDRKSTRLNSSHLARSRMPSSA